MDQESFESLLKAKFEGKGKKAPRSVWTGISNSLNEVAIVEMEGAHVRYKWIAIAAIFLAIFSFALSFDGYQGRYDASGDGEKLSFNALRPNTTSKQLLGESDVIGYQISDFLMPTNILFVKEDQIKTDLQPIILIKEDERSEIALHEVNGVKPPIEQALTKDFFNHYFVARTNYYGSTRSETSFWAGVEAGAGQFDPNFTGRSPISADVNFDALANSIGQSGFVNPSSSAIQDGMNEGLVTTLGIDFGMKMGKKWTIESGLQYATIQNQSSASLNVVDVYTIRSSGVASFGDGLEPPIVGSVSRETEVEERFDHSINLDNQMSFTSIPIKAGYYLSDDRLSFRVNAGLSANYFLSNRLSDPSGQLQNSTQSSSEYNEWSFDGLTGFEVGYQIADHFNLTLEPNYRQSITPLSKNLNSRSGFMVQTGLRYTIK